MPAARLRSCQVTVRDAAELLSVIAGSDPADPATRDADRRKTGIMEDIVEQIVGEIADEAQIAAGIHIPFRPGQRAATGQIINNFLYNPTLQRQDDQFDVKVNHRISEKNQFFARYSFERSEQFLPASLPHGDAGATTGNGAGGMDGNASTNAATENMMLKDATTNDADTNLANGL